MDFKVVEYVSAGISPHIWYGSRHSCHGLLICFFETGSQKCIKYKIVHHVSNSC